MLIIGHVLATLNMFLGNNVQQLSTLLERRAGERRTGERRGDEQRREEKRGAGRSGEELQLASSEVLG